MRVRINRGIVAGVLCAGILAGATGCGDDGGSGAQETAEALVEARNTGDGEAFCELLSDEVRERLGTENCAAFIEEQSAGTPTKFELVGVDEEGDKAVVTMKAIRSEGETSREAELQIGLEKQDGDWRVAALGSPDS